MMIYFMMMLFHFQFLFVVFAVGGLKRRRADEDCAPSATKPAAAAAVNASILCPKTVPSSGIGGGENSGGTWPAFITASVAAVAAPAALAGGAVAFTHATRVHSAFAIAETIEAVGGVDTTSVVEGRIGVKRARRGVVAPFKWDLQHGAELVGVLAFSIELNLHLAIDATRGGDLGNQHALLWSTKCWMGERIVQSQQRFLEP